MKTCLTVMFFRSRFSGRAFLALTATLAAFLVGCTTTPSGNNTYTTPSSVTTVEPGRPAVLLEMFMDTRPLQEKRGESGSKLTIETKDRDFSDNPQAYLDQALSKSLQRRGITVLNRQQGRAPLILSGEIRHFHGQIQLTRLPSQKKTATSSFLPANFHAAVQVMATLFDVDKQQILFRKSFLATRDERHSMSESKPKESKQELVRMVDECLQEVAASVGEEAVTHLQQLGDKKGPNR